MNPMKTNYSLLLILLLSFTFVNAQSEVSSIEVENNSVISVSKMNKEVTKTFNSVLNVINKKQDLLIDASEVKEVIARTNSDIRTYLNRKRKVDNIKVLFPKINRAVKA